METGKPGLASSVAAVAAQTERRMEVQAPMTALYIHTVPALPPQPLPQPLPQPPLAALDPSTLHLTMPPLYSKETLPFLTLHIAAGGLQPGLSVTAPPPPAAKPKSSGKHLCPHCGRDCMKPSVLEKHLRCHTGERPYPCTVCGVSFKTQSNLYKHKRTQAHARLSSESEQNTSLDSISWSTETGLSVDESVGVERDPSLPVAQKTPAVTRTSESNENTASPKSKEQAKLPQSEDKPKTERPSPINRHVVLQRQEATLFSKQWESSVSNSKSQSHESTDSGFSESSEIYPSPGSLLPDHSMDSLTETTTEHGEETASHQEKENQEEKVIAKEQENRSLEERITKLISQNSVVVEDKHLENVRPRKTVLSKQGSIDLPMPYTYKDSFHFDMRISKMSNSNRKPGMYNSVPSQQSTNSEHAPLIRSNSLPFSVSLLQPDQSCPTSSSYHRDYTTLFRRGSSGQINPTGFAIKSVNQQSSTHRPLVRQAAVDCNHAADALFKNSSVEEACSSSTRCQGEAGDICAETGSRKFRRKKAQKFAYNKWYMYGGGTFKKLYDLEKAGENKGAKSMPSPEVIQSLQKRLSAGHCETTVVSSPQLVRSATVHGLEAHSSRPQLMPSVSFNSQPSHILASPITPRLPLRRNLSLSVLPVSFFPLTPNLNLDPKASPLSNELSCSASQIHVNIPSDRKKQRTDVKLCSQDSMETEPKLLSPHSCTIVPPHLNQINIRPNPAVSLFLGSNSPATPVSTALQSSFMPKYQLKLPNTSDSIQVGSKTTQSDIISTCVTTSTSITTHQNVSAPKNCSFAPTLSIPCTASQTDGISPVVHQCPVADTKTTASLRNSHVGHFSSIIQSSSFGTVAPIILSNTSVTPIHRTQSSPAAFTPFKPAQQQPTPPKSSPSSSTSQPNPDTNPVPVMPCQIVPGQQNQSKVFHVQTADLQICFQIISDEQLALIEPQIEKQTEIQTVQGPASANEVRTCTNLESTDGKVTHCESNKEVEKRDQESSVSQKSEEQEQQTVHLGQASGPALSNTCHKDEDRKDSGSVEVEVSTDPKVAMLEKSQIPQKELTPLCNVALEQTSHEKESKGEMVSQTFSEEQTNVPGSSHCPRNIERTKCEENSIKFGNEEKVCFGNTIKSATRSNLQLSMVSLSLSQTNPSSVGQSERSLSHGDDSKQTESTDSASTETPTSAASGNASYHTKGCIEEISPVGSAELQTEGHQQQQQKCRQSHKKQENMQEQEVGDRADSIANCWPSGQQPLLHLPQTQPGMCGHPARRSGPGPDLKSENSHFRDPQTNLKTDFYFPQQTESATIRSPTNEPSGSQDGPGPFQKQDQRPRAEDAIVNFSSQSHILEKPSYSSVFVKTSSLMCQEEPPEPCDRFPSLFGVGGSFSYCQSDPTSGAVRVVQSSMDAEDSSSDDEGKLIIEL